MRELWMRATEAARRRGRAFASLEDVAFAFVERLQPAVAGGRAACCAPGRALVEIAEGTDRLDAAGVARLRQLVDRAAVEVARAIEGGRSGRRGAWLSFLAHELKNPLNTMLNALWLLARARRRCAAGRRASSSWPSAPSRSSKSASAISRSLDQQLGGLPPGWEGRPPSQASIISTIILTPLTVRWSRRVYVVVGNENRFQNHFHRVLFALAVGRDGGPGSRRSGLLHVARSAGRLLPLQPERHL